MSATTGSTNDQNTKSNKGLSNALSKYGPLVTIVVFIAMFFTLGYIAGNFMGQILGATYGQASASSYLAAQVINGTTHATSAANVVQSMGSYYYLQSMTVPNEYSIVGGVLGGLIGLLISFGYLEDKHANSS